MVQGLKFPFLRSNWCSGASRNPLTLIIEVPREAETQHALIEWVVRGIEIVLVARTCIDMAHHDEEATLLELEVGIDIDDRIITHLGAQGGVLLHTIHAYLRTVFWCIVAGEIAHIGT